MLRHRTIKEVMLLGGLAESVSPPAALPTAVTDDGENHVYLYSEVTRESCLALIKELRLKDERLYSEHVRRALPENFQRTPIWLHIFSEGGELFASLGMIDQLRSLKTPVYSVIEGYAASGATIISMACTRRYITPNSLMMIHQLSSEWWGKHEDFKDEMRLQEMLMSKMVAFYVARSKVDEPTVREMLKPDYWMDADKALELGFVDEIYMG